VVENEKHYFLDSIIITKTKRDYKRKRNTNEKKELRGLEGERYKN